MLCVDRCEDGIIVCEDEKGRSVRLKAEDCEGSIADGDVLVMRGGKYRVSRRLTDRRRAKAAELGNRLFERNS